MKKVSGFVWSKMVRVCAVLAVAMSALSLSAFAADETTGSSEAVMTAFQTGFASMAGDAMKMIAIIVPIGLGVAGVVWLARKALGWFKSMSK